MVMGGFVPVGLEARDKVLFLVKSHQDVADAALAGVVTTTDGKQQRRVSLDLRSRHVCECDANICGCEAVEVVRRHC